MNFKITEKSINNLEKKCILMYKKLHINKKKIKKHLNHTQMIYNKLQSNQFFWSFILV